MGGLGAGVVWARGGGQGAPATARLPPAAAATSGRVHWNWNLHRRGGAAHVSRGV